MRPFIGLLYALGGAAAGLMLGVGAGMLIVRLANITDREGASGYAILGVGILGALLGLVAGISLFVRSAPPGEGSKQLVGAVLGLTALVLVVLAGVWSMMQLREAPLEYDGAMATLEMELRFKTDDVPSAPDSRWLYVEVQTNSTRPEGTPLHARAREEDGHTIIPVVQQPLFRAGKRTLVVRINDRHTERYDLPMMRTPDPRADWSAWLRPSAAEGASGDSMLSAMTEARYRVRRYGD
jgi:hypothetical protein